MSDKEYLEIINKFKEENKEKYEAGKIRKVFTECLNKKEKNIDWINNVEHKIYFIYQDIEGYIFIKDYQKNRKHFLTIEYNNKQKDIHTSHFLLCQLGNILNKITGDFKVEIGQIAKDEKRDIIITDRKIRSRKIGKYFKKEKWYKYTCKVCGWTEGWIEETDFLNEQGCSCCSNRIPVLGINTIYDTDKWMIPFIGEECAKTHTHCSGDKVEVICPDCGRTKSKKMELYSIYNRHSIACLCSDKIPYPEKIMFSILHQLNIDFKIQLSKSNFEWCKDYRYDFYFELNNEQYVIETNGNQHYNEAFKSCGGQTIDEVQLNDKIKKELALKSGIKEENYIVIDCRKSELDWIRDNENGVLNSSLNKMFDLGKIDWLKCEEFALSNRIKEVCELQNSNSSIMATQISDITKLSLTTVVRYLKKGIKLGWSDYKTQKEKSQINIGIICDLWNNGLRNTQEISKIIKMSQTAIRKCLEKGNMLELISYNSSILQDINNINRSSKIKEISCKSIISIDKGIIFGSSKQCSDESEEKFGVNLTLGGITRVCRGERTHYKGFKFKFTQDLTEEQIKEIQENSELNKAI